MGAAVTSKATTWSDTTAGVTRTGCLVIYLFIIETHASGTWRSRRGRTHHVWSNFCQTCCSRHLFLSYGKKVVDKLLALRRCFLSFQLSAAHHPLLGKCCQGLPIWTLVWAIVDLRTLVREVVDSPFAAIDLVLLYLAARVRC